MEFDEIILDERLK